jgi:Ala-tRNA(Pro) deacylase
VLYWVENLERRAEMDASPSLRRFLDDRKIPHSLESHPETITSQETAAAAHVTGWAFAKPVIVNADGKLYMAVIPAPDVLAERRLRKCLGAGAVRLAREEEFVPIFVDCEPGAMPIFGSLYGLPVLVAKELADNEEIVFKAGSHRIVARIRTRDYLAAENPRVCEREEMLA